VQELVELTQEAGGRGRSYVVAAGPFTTTEDLSYEPLAALLEYCTAHRPDVLILVGPFVDAEHPLVRDGTLDETFEEVYASRVGAQVAEFAEREGVSTRVLLVPSTRDAHHDPVLPQPPLPACAGAATLANPAVFACDEVVVGCCAADWLMACTKEEVSKAAGQVDRLPALASHLITQRR
jgi:DNA polymerase alpha subunit B